MSAIDVAVFALRPCNEVAQWLQDRVVVATSRNSNGLTATKGVDLQQVTVYQLIQHVDGQGHYMYWQHKMACWLIYTP